MLKYNGTLLGCFVIYLVQQLRAYVSTAKTGIAVHLYGITALYRFTHFASI